MLALPQKEIKEMYKDQKSWVYGKKEKKDLK